MAGDLFPTTRTRHSLGGGGEGPGLPAHKLATSADGLSHYDVEKQDKTGPNPLLPTVSLSF